MVTNDELLKELNGIKAIVVKLLEGFVDREMDKIGKKMEEKKNSEIGTGIIITDDPNHGQPPTKQKNIPKIPANGKIPSRYKISSKVCKYCEGTIAWPRVFVTDKEVAEGKKRESSIHCDFDGNIEGDGRCPNF